MDVALNIVSQFANGVVTDYVGQPASNLHPNHLYGPGIQGYQGLTSAVFPSRSLGIAVGLALPTTGPGGINFGYGIHMPTILVSHDTGYSWLARRAAAAPGRACPRRDRPPRARSR